MPYHFDTCLLRLGKDNRQENTRQRGPTSPEPKDVRYDAFFPARPLPKRNSHASKATP